MRNANRNVWPRTKNFSSRIPIPKIYSFLFLISVLPSSSLKPLLDRLAVVSCSALWTALQSANWISVVYCGFLIWTDIFILGGLGPDSGVNRWAIICCTRNPCGPILSSFEARSSVTIAHRYEYHRQTSEKKRILMSIHTRETPCFAPALVHRTAVLKKPRE